MSENAQKPRIRFKGFSDAWEQRKLGNVGTTYSGLSGKSKDDFGHGEAKFVTYMNVFSNSIASPLMVESVEIDNRQNKVLCGDVLFTTSSETPEEVGMSSVWLENTENTYLNSFCFGYRPTIAFNPYYLAYVLRSSSMRKNITFLAQGISRYNISKNKMMEIEIPIPEIEEQELVGEYFRKLDNLITLHQRKYDKLVDMKKALLEKMFPADGETIPKIRFKGFSDAWEQRKLNEVVTYHSSNLTASDASEIGKYDLYDANSVIGKTNTEPIRTKYITIIKDGAGVGRIRILPANTMFIGTMGGLQTTKSDLDFIYALLSRFELGKEYSGSTIPHIYFKDYGNNEYAIPKIKEQETIGAYFENLDRLITLHQRKLEKLKKIKSALLEKMFV